MICFLQTIALTRVEADKDFHRWLMAVFCWERNKFAYEIDWLDVIDRGKGEDIVIIDKSCRTELVSCEISFSPALYESLNHKQEDIQPQNNRTRREREREGRRKERISVWERKSERQKKTGRVYRKVPCRLKSECNLISLICSIVYMSALHCTNVWLFVSKAMKTGTFKVCTLALILKID